MKGVELPISTIVVIVLVLLVLVAIIGMFYGIWPKGVEAAHLESVKNSACQMLLSTGGCSDTGTDPFPTQKVYISNFDANKDTYNNGGIAKDTSCAITNSGEDNLFMLCKCWYSLGGIDKEIDKTCRTQVCHCPKD